MNCEKYEKERIKISPKAKIVKFPPAVNDAF